jgi:hypothetical protein
VVVGAHKKVSEVDEVERVVVIVVCALVVDVEREVVGTGVELEVVWVVLVDACVDSCVDVVAVAAWEEVEVEVEVEVEAWVVLEVAALEVLPELDPPTSKTTTFAVTPDGTVTTQKLAPPAPAAAVELVTPPIPSIDGSIEQGSPLHPEPEHSIFTPKVGVIVLRPDAVQMGFHAALT